MAEKKKILYIVEAMGGGVFTYIVDLANELVNKYDMYIAYAVRKQTPENYKDYFDKRIHLIEVKNFGRAIDPVKDIAAFFEVKKIAAEIKPDIIHLHSSKAGAIGRMAFNGKIPMFYTPHGYSFLMENYKPMKRRMFKLIESVCAKRNCTTISCSVGEHQESLKLTKRATYVNNGILEKKDCWKVLVQLLHEHPLFDYSGRCISTHMAFSRQTGHEIDCYYQCGITHVLGTDGFCTGTQRKSLVSVLHLLCHNLPTFCRSWHPAGSKKIWSKSKAV